MNSYPTYLIHYGVEGQKWHVRRYQNEDGSLTAEGKEHYGYGNGNVSGKKIFKSGVKTTASGVGDAFRAGNRTVRGVAKTAFKGNVVFAKNALSGAKSGFKTVMNGGDAKEGLNQIKKGVKSGADQAYEAKKQVAKDSAKLASDAAKSSAEKIASGTLATAAGTAKMAKNQIDAVKENNSKNSIESSGFKVDKWGYATKEKNGVEFTFDTDKNTGDAREKIAVCNKLENKLETITKNLDKERDRILKEELSDWVSPGKHNIKLKNVHVFDSESAEANYWDDGPNDPLGGHEITMEFNPRTGKFIRYSLNG